MKSELWSLGRDPRFLAVCTCVHLFLTWIFLSENISREHIGSVLVQTLQIFQLWISCPPRRYIYAALINISGVNTAVSAVAVSAVCQWTPQPHWRIYCSWSVSRKCRSCPMYWRDCHNCVLFQSAVSLEFPRQKRSRISVAAYSPDCSDLAFSAILKNI